MLANGSVYPKDHLLMIEEKCGLFRIAGLSHDEVKKKLFLKPLERDALKWYCSLDVGYQMK